MFRDGLRAHHTPSGASPCDYPTDRQRRRLIPPTFRPARGKATHRNCPLLTGLRIPATAHAPSCDASEQPDRHLPCRRLGCAEPRAISRDEYRKKTPTLDARGSRRPARRRVGRGTTRHPSAGLTSCYCVEVRQWILLARIGAARHTGQAFESDAATVWKVGRPVSHHGEFGEGCAADVSLCHTERTLDQRYPRPACPSAKRS